MPAMLSLEKSLRMARVVIGYLESLCRDASAAASLVGYYRSVLALTGPAVETQARQTGAP